jgi:NADH-quinone oxidoreductase subunit L
MVFWGRPRTEAAAHAHESPAVMTMPLVVLAAFALLGGLVFGLPLENGIFHHWLEPALEGLGHHEGEGFHLPIVASLVISSVVAIAGIALAYRRYGAAPPETVEGATVRRGGLLYQGSLNKWYVDEIYNALVVRPYEMLAAFSARFFDRYIIDGAVNGVAVLLGAFGGLASKLQGGFVRSYALGIILGLVLITLILMISIPNDLRSYFSLLGRPALVTIAAAVVLMGGVFLLTLRQRPGRGDRSDSVSSEQLSQTS